MVAQELIFDFVNGQVLVRLSSGQTIPVRGPLELVGTAQAAARPVTE